jgi:hypothetical protein
MKKIILFTTALLVITTVFAKRIKFQVNMTGQTISPNGVHIAGNFQGWDPTTTLMTNGGSGNIYSVLLNIPAKVVLEYKFINGNTWSDVEFTPTITRVGSVINGNFNDNRWFYLDSLANDTTIVPAFLFSGSAPAGLRAVRFAVEFQNSTIINNNGVHIAGSFQGWNPASTRMSNLYTSNKIYEYITYLDTNFHQFKYINGNTWADNEIVPSACSNVGGNRLVRTLVDLAINKVCFGQCNLCSNVSIIPKFNVTFKVDMLNADCLGGLDSVTIAGNNMVLTNWGEGVKLTQVGTTSIYTAQILLDSSVIEYKFRFHKNGNTNWEGNSNRIHVLIKDTVLAPVCFGNINGVCNPKPAPSTVTFKVDLSNEVPDPNGKIYVMGTFTNPNWRLGAIRLAPSPGQPGVYFVNVPNVCWGSFNYLFLNGDSSISSSQEIFPDTNQRSCLTPNGLGGFNRTYTRTSANPVTLFYQFNKCTPCFFNTSLSIADTVVAYKQDSVLLNAGSGYSKYKWSRGDTTQSIWVKTSGNYNIAVSNSSGCIYNKSIAVFFVKGIQQKDTSICLGKSLNLNVQGASKVLWSTNDTSNSIIVTPTLSTTYRCTQRIGSFVMIDSVRITVNSLLNIQRITSSDTLSFCGYNSKFLIGVTTNYIGTKNYLWYKNDTLLTGKTLAIDTFTTAGKYKVTITTPTGCYQEQSFFINKLNSTFNPDFSVNKQIDSVPPFDFIFSNNTTPLADYNFTWKWGNGDSAISNNLIQFYTYSANGQYNVKLVAQNKLTGCKDSIIKNNFITCSGLYPLSLSTLKTNPICNNGNTGSISVTAIGGFTPYQYKLNAGSYQTSNSFTNLGAGIYTVYVKDANNTIVSKIDTLINPAANSIGTISGLSAVATNSIQAYSISAQSGATYAWNIINGTLLSGNGTNSIQVQWASLTGVGKVLISLTKNACTVTDSLNIVIGNPPLTMATIVVNPPCSGTNNGSITVNANGGNPPYQFKLNNGTYQTASAYSNLGAGIYTISVKDASNNTISKTDTINFQTILNNPIISGSNGVPVSSTQNYNIASQNGVVYTWNIINGTLLSGNGTNNIQVQWAAVSGMGKVIANIAKNSCSAADTMVVSIGSNPLTSSTTKTDETCAGKANGAITINATGGTSPYQYSINNGTFQTGNTFNNLVAGIYVSKVKDASNVISQNTDTIIAGPGITVGVINGNNAVKPLDLVKYFVLQQIGATYIWNVIGGNITSGQGTDTAQVSWGATAGVGTVKVKVTSAAGCVDSTMLNVTIGSTNISTIGKAISYTVYPNPAKDELIISTNQKLNGAHVIITDMIGRRMLEENITNASNEHTILVSELKSGTYILSIQKEGETSRIKFVKE